MEMIHLPSKDSNENYLLHLMPLAIAFITKTTGIDSDRTDNGSLQAMSCSDGPLLKRDREHE